MINTEATASTPAIAFDEGTRTLSVSGESYPENSFVFYAPLFDWLGAELEKQPSFRLLVNVSYMNSSSTKCMLDILDMLCEAAQRGKDVRITWLYEADNERALDLAEEFREDVEIPFEIKPIGSGSA
jgi:hypothetical protein